jgi:hypothetical protein
LTITFSPTSLPADTVNIPYSQTIEATGVAPVKLTVNVTQTVAGFSVPTSGTGSLTISGTPAATGTESFTVTATGANGQQKSNAYNISVNPTVTLSPTASNLPADMVGVAYSRTISASGGTGTVTLAVSNPLVNGTPGTGIPGLTPLIGANGLPLSGTGSLVISGTPTAAGTETFTVTATDTTGATASQSYSITVSPVISFSLTTLPGDTLPGDGDVIPGDPSNTPLPYYQTITTSGGTGPVTLTVTSLTNNNSLPLAVLGSGTSTLTISGTPTTTGTETFTVSAKDSVGVAVTNNYTITVNPPMSFSPAATTLPAGVENAPYSQSISDSGGTGPVSLTVTLTGAEIPGLSVPSASGLSLSGTPTGSGTETFTVTAEDALGVTATTSYSITVIDPASLSSTITVLPGTNVAEFPPAGSVADLIADITYCNENPGSYQYQIPLAATSNPNDPSTYPLYALNVANNNGVYGPTGLPVIAAGDSLTLVGNNAVIQRTGARCRLFAVGPQGSLTLENLTLQDGWADARYYSPPLPAAAADGGAIYCDVGSTLTLSGQFQK